MQAATEGIVELGPATVAGVLGALASQESWRAGDSVAPLAQG